MRKQLVFALIIDAVKTTGEYSWNENAPFMEERMTLKEISLIEPFLNWVAEQKEERCFGWGNIEERYDEWLVADKAITFPVALTARHFEHREEKNADKTPVRCRRSGKTQTWKTRPGKFKIPVKYGLKHSFYITEDNAHEWRVSADEDIKPLYRLTSEFQVRDALGGAVSGDYAADLQRLQMNGQTCSEELYNEAHQMSEQP